MRMARSKSKEKVSYNKMDFVCFPPQGFRPEGEIPRRHLLVTCAYIKENTYRWNIQSVWQKNLDLLEQGPRGIGR